MRTVCLIPARGGSVRIPRKNIKLFHGKPIIAYSIENAQKSGLFDEIWVSTDDEEIDLVARCAGARVYRRAADDGARGTQEVAKEFLDSFLGRVFGMCCVHYPCAPLLMWQHVVYGWQGLIHSMRPFAYSVDDDGKDIGGFYWGFAQAFREGLPLDVAALVPIPAQRCCDINSPDDWDRAVRMYGELHGN